MHLIGIVKILHHLIFHASFVKRNWTFFLFSQLCYLDRVVFKVRTVKRQFPTLRGWTNDKVKSREEQAFEVDFSKGAHEGCLDESERPAEAQVVHEEEPSNATPEATAEAEHDTVRSKTKVYEPLY